VYRLWPRRGRLLRGVLEVQVLVGGLARGGVGELNVLRLLLLLLLLLLLRLAWRGLERTVGGGLTGAASQRDAAAHRAPPAARTLVGTQRVVWGLLVVEEEVLAVLVVVLLLLLLGRRLLRLRRLGLLAVVGEARHGAHKRLPLLLLLVRGRRIGPARARTVPAAAVVVRVHEQADA
jgi:hypothetical protein